MDDGDKITAVAAVGEAAGPPDAVAVDLDRESRILAGAVMIAGCVGLLVLTHDMASRVIAVGCGAVFVYLMVRLLLFPPFVLRANSVGLEVAWSDRAPGIPVTVHWDEIASMSIRSARSLRWARLAVYTRDLRPAIRRSRSARIRALLWSRQLTPHAADPSPTLSAPSVVARRELGQRRTGGARDDL